MATLSKFLIDKPILLIKGLDVFCEFSYFLSLQLSQLCLLIYLLSKILKFSFKNSNLIFSFKQFSLVVVFFAGCHTHLVLNITEVKALFLQLLSCVDKLFSFGIKLGLHLIQAMIKHRNWLFQIVYLLVFWKQFTLVWLDIVD